MRGEEEDPMSQIACLFYRAENVCFPSMTMSADHGPIRVAIVCHGWCAHSKSRYKQQHIFGPSVPCGGDPEKCADPTLMKELELGANVK